MKNKKVHIVLGIVIILVLIILCIFLLTNKSKDERLSSFDKLILNSEEEEIVTILRKMKESLLNINNKEENNSNTIALTISEPVKLEDFITTLHEVRKYRNENNELLYILDIETKFKDKEPIRRLCTFGNDKLFICLTNEDIDYSSLGEETINQNEDGSISYSFGAEFYKSMINELNQQMNEIWEKAEKFQNVNYNKVLKEI